MPFSPQIAPHPASDLTSYQSYPPADNPSDYPNSNYQLDTVKLYFKFFRKVFFLIFSIVQKIFGSHKLDKVGEIKFKKRIFLNAKNCFQKKNYNASYCKTLIKQLMFSNFDLMGFIICLSMLLCSYQFFALKLNHKIKFRYPKKNPLYLPTKSSKLRYVN